MNHQRLLLIQAEGRTLKISTESVVQIEAVIHPPGAAGHGRSASTRLAHDGAQRILSCRVQTLKLKAREQAALLRGVDEGEDYRLGLFWINRLGDGKLTAIAR